MTPETESLSSRQRRALLRQECDRLSLSVHEREQVVTHSWCEIKHQVSARISSPPVLIGIAAGTGLLIGLRRRPLFARLWPGWPALGRVAMLLWSARQASEAAAAAKAAEEAASANGALPV
ncbi:hypothetical protein [Chitinimonas lacunae]|uniref:DUF3618 domain-containing protein n=1 Tax=Chitinimonas lacunae TaxID=1963018 RepID=A0ABV8MM72_9NEIS